VITKLDGELEQNHGAESIGDLPSRVQRIRPQGIRNKKSLTHMVRNHATCTLLFKRPSKKEEGTGSPTAELLLEKDEDARTRTATLSVQRKESAGGRPESLSEKKPPSQQKRGGMHSN